MMGLTKKQVQVLAFIQARMPRVWRAPSYPEIAVYQGVAIQPNYQHARRLERKGTLASACTHRNIHLSPEHGPPAYLSPRQTEQRYDGFGAVEGGILTVRLTYRRGIIRLFGTGYGRKGRQIYARENHRHQ